MTGAAKSDCVRHIIYDYGENNKEDHERSQNNKNTFLMFSDSTAEIDPEVFYMLIQIRKCTHELNSSYLMVLGLMEDGRILPAFFRYAGRKQCGP